MAQPEYVENCYFEYGNFVKLLRLSTKDLVLLPTNLHKSVDACGILDVNVLHTPMSLILYGEYGFLPVCQQKSHGDVEESCAQ